MKKKYLAPSVKKAFDILETISRSRDGMGLSEISKKLNMAKSTVHGVTAILEEIGAVARDPSTKKYGLGLTLFQLGRRVYSQIDLREIARPFMEELMEKIQETVFLGILHGEHITIIDVVECRHDFKITSPIGSNIPVLAAATGKVYLAGFDEEEARRIINSKGLPRYTDKSITDPDFFIEEVRKAKVKGYASDDEEYISGVRAIAASINRSNDTFALLWVVGFKSSLNDEKMERLRIEIIRAVNAVRQKNR